MQDVRVLVVEDEGLILVELEEVIEAGGYSALTAHNGEDALQKLERHDDLRVIVTDVNLGGGVDGWSLARSARQRSPHIPVVYVTSVSHDEWSAQGVPGSILIHKPFAPAQIITAISQLLNLPDAAD